MTSLRQALLLGKGGVISLVGAGGKTSLMFRLAHELTLTGDSVLTTTTTKIYAPEPAQSSCVLVSDSITELLAEARGLIDEHRHVTMARNRGSEEGKLIGFSPEAIDAIRDSRFFRWIIVEADGAAGRPLKAPAEHEPVVPQSTNTVIGLAGLSGIGRPLTDQWVFRPDRFTKVSGVPFNASVEETAIARAFFHQNGIFKNSPMQALRLVFLNQADLPEDRDSGRRIASLLMADSGAGIKRVVVGQLRSESPVWKFFDPRHAHHQ
jgi:probable selenium-dependent hydroxylase accessory protein YqeC